MQDLKTLRQRRDRRKRSVAIAQKPKKITRYQITRSVVEHAIHALDEQGRLLETLEAMPWGPQLQYVIRCLLANVTVKAFRDALSLKFPGGDTLYTEFSVLLVGKSRMAFLGLCHGVKSKNLKIQLSRGGVKVCCGDFGKMLHDGEKKKKKKKKKEGWSQVWSQELVDRSMPGLATTFPMFLVSAHLPADVLTEAQLRLSKPKLEYKALQNARLMKSAAFYLEHAIPVQMRRRKKAITVHITAIKRDQVFIAIHPPTKLTPEAGLARLARLARMADIINPRKQKTRPTKLTPQIGWGGQTLQFCRIAGNTKASRVFSGFEADFHKLPVLRKIVAECLLQLVDPNLVRVVLHFCA